MYLIVIVVPVIPVFCSFPLLGSKRKSLPGTPAMTMRSQFAVCYFVPVKGKRLVLFIFILNLYIIAVVVPFSLGPRSTASDANDDKELPILMMRHQ